MAGDDPFIQDPFFTLISTENAATRAAKLEQARATLTESDMLLQEKEHQAIATKKLSVQWKPGYHGPSAAGPQRMVQVQHRASLLHAKISCLPKRRIMRASSREGTSQGLPREANSSRSYNPHEESIS
jgi:hypothetical protein